MRVAALPVPQLATLRRAQTREVVVQNSMPHAAPYTTLVSKVGDAAHGKEPKKEEKKNSNSACHEVIRSWHAAHNGAPLQPYGLPCAILANDDDVSKRPTMC